MFCELIIRALPELVKFFKILKLDFFFTKPQIRHLYAFVTAMMMRGFGGKMSDISELSLNAHRTCIGRFLDSDAWDCGFLFGAVKGYVVDAILEESKRTGLPIYAAIDDTLCEKTKPRSRSKSPIYGCSFHKSHTADEMVYGQQFVCLVLRCGDLSLPFAIVLYERNDDKSKVHK